MSETKHTPGPWKALPCRQVPDRGAVYVEGADGWDQTPVCSTYETTDREENEANACLIAAAPEMLHVLEQVLPLVQLLAAKMNNPKQTADATEAIFAVLAKAKGV